MEWLQSAMATTAFAAILILSAATAQGAPPEVPDAERALLNTVDPWGLPFSDQLTRFQRHFSEAPDASFALGITHDLVKVWPVKYWFRGETVAAGEPAAQVPERWAAAGETLSFQVAALPRMGAGETEYSIAVKAEGAQVAVYKQVFVTTSAGAAYPRYASDRWPDPLVPAQHAVAGGADLCLFWVDVAIPPTASGTLKCTVTLQGHDGAAEAAVPIRVVSGLDLDPKAYPFIGWFRRHKMTPEQYREHCALVLEHHMMPVDALKGQWDPADPAKFDDLRTYLEGKGQRLFEVDGPSSKDFDSLYAHLKEKGWLASTVIYSNQDEPDDETFVGQNIPFMQMVRDKYPGLKVYLASDWHENMHEGCDAWMTDISSSGYDPERHKTLQHPELWHYYCHLPVRWQMRAPLVDAPNMQIDNPALEHRLALWMSRYYGAKVVFIWAGNAYTFGPDFWDTLKLSDEPSGFPYAGVHNGNGWVVYPTADGQGTLPSLRLKVIRDGLEDLALMEAARRALAEGRVTEEQAATLETLLDPVPGVFVHPQFFDRLPETLLAWREAILRTLAQ